MSVEAPMGGISAPSIAAVPAVSAAPSMEVASMSGPSISSLEGFNSFAPMTVNVSSVREGPAPSSVFSSDFSVISERSGISPVAPMSSEKIDAMFGTKPFIPSSQIVSEGVAAVSLPEMTTLWQREVQEVPSVEPQRVENIVSRQIESVVEAEREVELTQAMKVKKLFEEVGVSSQGADEIVIGIIEEKGIDIEGNTSLEMLGHQLEPNTAQAKLDKTETGDKPKEKESERAGLKGKEVEVDENAQNARSEAIEGTLREAEPNDLVSGVDVAQSLSQTADQKSEILYQIGMPEEEDGSLREATKQISKIGQVEVSSLKSKVGKILDRNRPVRIVESAKNEAEKEEVEKVLEPVHRRYLIQVSI